MVHEDGAAELGLANTVMGELQATIEIQVEIGKFYNVDLFQRGYYQIRTSLKTAPKIPVKTEVSLPHNSECDLVFPASIMNGVAVSKTFQILYRNEDVLISDVVLFKLHTLVDANKVNEGVAATEIQLVVELWFSDDEFGPDQQEKLSCISARSVKLNLVAIKGLHHHVPLLFDYFHLSAVTLSIHASLLSLNQPYLSLRAPAVPGQQPPKQAWTSTRDSPTLESLLFGPSFASQPANHKYALNPRVEHAHKKYRTICHALLSVYESLQASFEGLTRKLPAHMQIKIEHVDCHQKLEKLTGILKKVEEEETLLEVATSDVAQLCAENVILWTQYLELVTANDSINHILAKQHHTERVKRFSEAFFTNEFSKSEIVACYEASVHGHSDLAALVKGSPYFQGLLPLPAECWDMDGDHTTLPVIFEDVYCEASVAKHLHTTADEPARFGDRVGDAAAAGGTTLTTPPAPSLPRKGSRQSDTSSQHSGSDTSPRTRKYKSFIKNIKPEAFKRPSSFLTDGAAGGNVAVDAVDCSLVGYRKLDNVVASPTAAAPSVELGTLSPGGTHAILLPDAATKNALYNAVSMPTLLAKSQLGMSGSGSLPDLSSKEGLLDTTVTDLSHMLPPGGLTASGSDSALPRDTSGVALGARNPEKPSDVISTSDSSSDSSHMQNVQNGYISSESDKGSPMVEEAPPPTVGDSSAAQAKGEVDYKLLADSLTQALGEPDTGAVAKPPAPSGAGATSDTITAQNQSNNTAAAATDDNTQSNSDKDTETGRGSGSSPGRDGVDSRGGDSSGLGESVSTEPEDGQQARAASTDVDSISLQSKPKSEDSDELSLSGQCTLMELLKEEYERSERSKTRHESRERAHPAVTSTNSLSSIQVEKSGRRGANRLTHGERILSLMASSSTPDLAQYRREQCLVSPVGDSTISFITAKENLRRQMKYSGHIYSDFPTQVSTLPYFWTPEIDRGDDAGIHLVVCVHGLDGNSADLRLIRTFLEMALPNARLDFLMSERNQPDTFADFEVMTDRLVDEILYHIELYGMTPSRISFVGHSLGNLIIRSALSRPKMATLLPRLHTFLSLSGPHLGTLYNTSGLVNMGMWFMQKWKKSGSLLQLSLKDHTDPRQTFLYQLSTKPGLEFFRNVLLVGSSQDRYVPFHSSRIELCRAAAKDSSTLGAVYCEMASNLLQPLVMSPRVTLVRYDVFHALPNTANSLIGRAAHIAVLDSELFIEKFITVSALKFFR